MKKKWALVRLWKKETSQGNSTEHIHQWKYYQTSTDGVKYFRFCTLCHAAQRYTEFPVFGKGWFGMVEFTDKGVEELEKRLKKSEKKI